MEILFDHQTFRNQRYGGISLYVGQLIKGINQYNGNRAQVTIPGFKNENMPPDLPNVSSVRNAVWELMPRKGRRISNAFSLYALLTNRYDVFHATYYDPYFLAGIARNKPWTFTYHDMTHEVMGERFPSLAADQRLIRAKEQLVHKAPTVIAISEHTKQDMVNHYQVNPDKIRVIHHGNPYEQLVWTSMTAQSSFSFPYILFVGDRWPYKNFLPFVKAAANILKRYSIHLVCAGGGAFKPEEIASISECKVDNLVHYQPIRNNTLPNLYRHAIAFAFPSLYEGFGLSILEAFACQCPCILSQNSSFPEIAGPKGAIYFDPNDADSMCVALEKVIIDESLRTSLIKHGIKRLKNFTWQKTIMETMQVYEGLVE